jgi:hypothetical protein
MKEAGADMKGAGVGIEEAEAAMKEVGMGVKGAGVPGIWWQGFGRRRMGSRGQGN